MWPRDLERSRDRLADGLGRDADAVLPSQGTYFLTLDLPASGIGLDDRAFCLHAVRQAGVAAIPVSAFYEEGPVTHILRLCFSRRNDTLDAGIARLARARDLIRD